jgi:hypothetical protein
VLAVVVICAFCIFIALCVIATQTQPSLYLLYCYLVRIPVTVPLTMFSNHDLAAAARAPELRFRKRAYVGLVALLLIAIGVIAITNTPSRRNGSEDFLFNRNLTFFHKGSESDETEASPTMMPTAMPTMMPTVTPTTMPTMMPTVTPTTMATMMPTVTPVVECKIEGCKDQCSLFPECNSNSCMNACSPLAALPLDEKCPTYLACGCADKEGC